MERELTQPFGAGLSPAEASELEALAGSVAQQSKALVQAGDKRSELEAERAAVHELLHFSLMKRRTDLQESVGVLQSQVESLRRDRERLVADLSEAEKRVQESAASSAGAASEHADALRRLREGRAELETLRSDEAERVRLAQDGTKVRARAASASRPYVEPTAPPLLAPCAVP